MKEITMDVLNQQVRLARRRLLTQTFFRALGWCAFAALAVAALGVSVIKFWPVEVSGLLWTAAWVGGSLAVAMLAAAGWTYAHRQSPIDAAYEIDRRFGLKERVSSTLSLAADERETEAGQALIADAQRRVDRLDVAEQFKLRPSRRALLPLAPALAVFALVFVADQGRESEVAATTLDLANKKQIDASAEQVRKLAAKREQQAKDEGLKDAEHLFRQVEERTRDLAEKSKSDPKQAMSKLNDLAIELQNRRQQLGGDDKLRQQLDGMKNFKQGPADGLAKAMKNGDFKKALDELNKMKQDLAKGELDADKQAALGKQLEQMQQALQKLADAQQKAKADAQAQQQQQQKAQAAAEKNLQKQIDQAKQQGDQATAEALQKQLDKAQQDNKTAADKLQEQIDKLGQQDAQANRLRQLADKLSQASKAMQNGQPQQAQEALDQLGQDLQNLKQEASEMAMLDDALKQIDQAKQSMSCKKCGGAGCESCQGQSHQSGQGGDGKSDKQGKGDFAKGEGRAYGKRGEEQTETGTRDSKVGQNVGAGGSVVKDLVEGPNIKGQVQQEIKSSVEAAKHDEADPLVGQRLPRSQREHAQQYFDALRKGE